MAILGERNAELGIALTSAGLSGKWHAIRHDRAIGYVLERLGSHADPEPTEAELLAALAQRDKQALFDLSDQEARRRIARATQAEAPDQIATLRQQVMLLGKAVRMLRKEATGRATPAEKAVLAQLEAMQDRNEAIEAARDAIKAVIASGAAVDVVNDPRWPA